MWLGDGSLYILRFRERSSVCKHNTEDAAIRPVASCASISLANSMDYASSLCWIIHVGDDSPYA